MAANVITPTREFRKLILSKREFQAASFNRCLHYGRRGVSISQPVTYVTILNLENKRKLKFELQKDGLLFKLLIWSAY